MLLENENAVIYGGGGEIGGAVARVFAHERTRVFLAGRTHRQPDLWLARGLTKGLDAFHE